jgi:hypothetical protein
MSVVCVEDAGATLRGFVSTMPLGADALDHLQLPTQHLLTTTCLHLFGKWGCDISDKSDESTLRP